MEVVARTRVRDIIQRVQRDGWREVSKEGSHRQYKHPTKPGKVTIAGHPSDDVAPGTLRSIQKQAGLKK
jgi:predicted RNA binding protein YcfA (HicA-like mRNA interferase family)